MGATFKHSLLLAVVLGLIASLAPSTIEAVSFDSGAEDCEERGMITYEGTDMVVIQCRSGDRDIIVLPNYMMMPIPYGSIAVIYDKVLHFYYPVTDALERADLRRLQWGDWQ